ncbi:hypothetical protein POUND7_001889 [Theobroma cacao]
MSKAAFDVRENDVTPVSIFPTSSYAACLAEIYKIFRDAVETLELPAFDFVQLSKPTGPKCLPTWKYPHRTWHFFYVPHLHFIHVSIFGLILISSPLSPSPKQKGESSLGSMELVTED